MSKVRVDTIATHDDSVEFDVTEIALLRDEVGGFSGTIDSIQEELNTTVKATAPTGAAIVPKGTTAQRPATTDSGLFRFNSETNQFEGFKNGAWEQIGGLEIWETIPIGMPFPIWDHISGVPVPPNNSSKYRFVKLTAADAYNTGVLTSESVSGSAPLVQAQAVVSLAGSPVNGQTVQLINTERRFIRAGNSGAVEADDFKSHNHLYGITLGYGSSQTGWNTIGGTGNTFASSYAGGTETRPKNIGATYYMRIK